MRHSKLLRLCVVAIAGHLSAAPFVGWADIVVELPAAMRTRIMHRCVSAGPQREFCATALIKPERVGVPQSVAGDNNDFYDYFNRDFKTPANREWNAQAGVALSGKVKVQHADATLCDRTVGGREHCSHGADVEMSYFPDAADPAVPAGQNRYWIQMTHYEGTGCKYTDPPFNPWRIDVLWGLTPPSINPPYYPYQSTGTAPDGKSYMAFEDSPRGGCIYDPHNTTCLASRACPAPCDWQFEAWSYVAYGTPSTTNDPNGESNGSMTVNDGVHWGFRTACGLCPNVSERVARGGHRRSATVQFDPTTETLSIGDCILDTLNVDGSEEMDPAFASDPILGATISMSDFTFFGAGDGIYVFEGGTYQIEKDGITFLEARIPWLVVDDESTAIFGTNLCAQMGDVTYDFSHGSAWLEAYAAADRPGVNYPDVIGQTTVPIEPYLASMMGFDTETSVWTAYCIPEPCSIALAALSLLVITCRRWRS